MTITDAFKEFNERYNNRTITLYNQTLELFDEHGDSDAGTVLQIISEELNMLKIKKDKFFKYKRMAIKFLCCRCFMFSNAYNFKINDI